jgi:hypothetical protein
MLNGDVGHRVQIAGVDDPAALNLYSQCEILQLNFLTILKVDRADPTGHQNFLYPMTNR